MKRGTHRRLLLCLMLLGRSSIQNWRRFRDDEKVNNIVRCSDTAWHQMPVRTKKMIKKMRGNCGEISNTRWGGVSLMQHIVAVSARDSGGDGNKACGCSRWQNSKSQAERDNNETTSGDSLQMWKMMKGGGNYFASSLQLSNTITFQASSHLPAKTVGLP